ncbi:MAG: sialate O-acetylesterase [Phycisphaerae bacterium]|nr:sialate O-acetylesterase [Phycisphaerae bacterium]
MKAARASLVVLCLSVLALAVSVDGAVRLPSVIGSNMVMQQRFEAPIWGWADPGRVVYVRASWLWTQRQATAGDNGRWQVVLPTPAAGGPYCITISDRDGATVLDNILIGEVWVGSGQSNMQWTVSSSNNAQEEIANAKYPGIRLFHVTRKVAETAQDDCEGSWQECSPEAVGGFSAAAYFFGRELHNELNVPVGLIHTSWGGTPAEAWTRREILGANDDFKPILDRYQKVLDTWEQVQSDYQNRVEEWKKASAQAKADGTRAPAYPGQPYGPGHPHSPAGLYNAMIAPLIPYGIRGAIWYQGESNAGRAYQYRTLFPAMIDNWRQDWKQGAFPFYFVQIAPYKGQTPEIREAQLIALRNTVNTGMAVTMDIGDPEDIHPRNKQDVGKRLALWALAKDYGRQDIVYSGPLYKGMKVEGDRIRLFFDYAAGGLAAKDGPLTYFTIAEAEGDFVPADAVIDGETIVVSSEAVKKPAAVRYGWQNSAEPNLFNKAGLPASPFRTDDRPGETYGKL